MIYGPKVKWKSFIIFWQLGIWIGFMKLMMIVNSVMVKLMAEHKIYKRNSKDLIGITNFKQSK